MSDLVSWQLLEIEPERCLLNLRISSDLSEKRLQTGERAGYTYESVHCSEGGFSRPPGSSEAAGRGGRSGMHFLSHSLAGIN